VSFAQSQNWLQFFSALGGAAFIIGAVLVAALWAMPHTRAKTKGAAHNLFSSALLFVGVCATLYWADLLALLVLLLAGGRVGWELSFALPAVSKSLLRGIGGAAAALPYLTFQEPLVFALMWLGMGALWWILRRSKAGLFLAALVHPGIPLMIISAAMADPALRPALLLAFVIGEIFDSFSFLSGRISGKTKLAPALSPSKTVAGVVGGAVMMVVLILAGWMIFDRYSLWVIPVALVIACFALAGDLWISGLKRAAKIKDFPTLLAPHGGLLDSLDGWILSAALFAALSLYWA
jgi:phosphatidate cytidylyltransferase